MIPRSIPSLQRICRLAFAFALVLPFSCSSPTTEPPGADGGSANAVGGGAGRGAVASGGSGGKGAAGAGGAGAGAGGGAPGSGGVSVGGGAGTAGTGGTSNTSGGANGGSSSNAGGRGAGGMIGTSGRTASGGANSGGSATAGASSGGVSSGGASHAGASNGGSASGSGGASGAAGSSAGAGDSVDATALAKTLVLGANIGNTFDNTTTWETGWGEPLVTQAYINGMASHGVKIVRVPVAWDTYAVNGVIDATKMDRVKQVVAWIEAAGMYSMVNIHWDGGWIDNDTDNNPNRYRLTDDVKTKFASYWTQIATAFSGVGTKLILEGLNEESKFYVNGDTSKPDYAALNTINQLFVTTVRAQSGYNKTRALLISGFTTDIDVTCVQSFTVPNDPAGAGKLFLSIHYYTPYTFCGLDTVESWGSPQTTWGTATDKSTLDGLFSKLATFSTERQIPVIIGEFGVTLGQNYPRDPASRTLWMESVIKAALAHNMVPVLWDTGSDISRADGSFSSALQTAVNDAMK